MADENDSQDFGDFLQRAIKPYSDAYRSLHETFKEYVPGYELLSAMEQKVIREASKMGKKKLLHPSLFNIPREKQDEFDLIDDEEFGILASPKEVDPSQFEGEEPPPPPEFKSDLDVAFDKLDRDAEGKSVSAWEEFVFGTAESDEYYADDPGSRQLAKLNDAVKRSLSVLTLGGAKGLAVVPQLTQLAYKYGLGSFESLGYIGNDSWKLDKDSWSANTLWRDFSEGAEAFEKDLQQSFGLGNLSTAEAIAMMTADFMVPLKFPWAAASAVGVAGREMKVIREMQEQHGYGIRLSDEFIEQQADLQKGILPAQLKKSELEDARLDPLREKLLEAEGLNDLKQINRIKNSINATKENILKEGLRNLKGPQGRGFPKLRKRGPAWWDFELRFAQPTRGEYITGARRTGKVNPRTGQPQYEDVTLVKGATPQSLAAQKQLRKVMEGSSIAGAGAVAGTWYSYFQGTELQDLAYAAGFAGAFVSPSAAMRVLDFTTSTASFPIMKVWEGVAVPFKYLGIPLPGAKGEVFRPSLGGLIHLGGYGINSLQRFFDVKDKGWGIDPLDFEYSGWAKRAKLTTMGVPFWKLPFIDGKTKLKDELGRETEWTDLDVFLAYSQRERNALRKMADMIASGEVDLPPQYLTSLHSAHLRVKEIAEEAGIPLVVKGAAGRLSVQNEFIITMEEIIGATVLSHNQQSLRYLMKDDLLRKNLFGFGKEDAGRLLNILRTSEAEVSHQLDVALRLLNDMSGEVQAKAYQTLKINGLKLIENLKKQNDEFKLIVQEIADNKASVFNVQKQVELRNNLLDSEVFALRRAFGLPELKPDEAGLAKQSFIDNEMKGPIDEAYELQKASKDEYFEIGVKEIEDIFLDAGDFVRSLESVKSKIITDLEPIMGVIKDVNRVKSFGGVTLRDPTKNLDFSSNIDDIIAYARYNGFQKITRNEDGSYVNREVTLDDMNKKTEDIIESFKGAEDDLILHNNRIPVDTDPVTGNFSLSATFRSLDEKRWHVQYMDNLGLRSAFGNNEEAMKIEYLKRLLANLKPKAQPTDIAGKSDFDVRTILSELLDEKLTVGDMHRIRSNMGRQSFKRKADPVGFQFREISKALDETFLAHNIDEISEANKIFTEWKYKWEESYAGRALIRSFADRGIDIKSLPDEKMLEVFLKAADSKIAGKLFKDLFDDFTDFSTKEKIDISQLRETIKRSMDISLGKWLYDSKGTLDITDGIDGSRRLEKINDLYNNGLISKEAHETATDIIKDISDISQIRGTAELDKSTKKINRLLELFTKAQQEAIKGSTGEDFSKINDTNQLYDFLFPKNMAETFGRETPVSEGRIGDVFEQLQERTLRARADQESLLRQEFPDEQITYTKEQVDELFKEHQPRPLEDITGTRLSALIRELTGLTQKDIVTGNISAAQSETIKELRNVLVWTMIKNNTTKIDERKASKGFGTMLRTSAQAAGFKLDENFDLSQDIDIVGMVKSFEDMAPHLNEMNRLVGRNYPDELDHLDRLRGMVESLVAIRADIPKLEDISSSIPAAITQAGAQSKIFAGLRGVVSWRYLATDQFVREYQRSKALLFYTLYTNPSFIRHLDTLVQGKVLSKQAAKEFFDVTSSVMAPRGLARIAIYNADEEKMNYDPLPGVFSEFVANMLRKELPFVDMSTWEMFAKPKAIRKNIPHSHMRPDPSEENEENENLQKEYELMSKADFDDFTDFPTRSV